MNDLAPVQMDEIQPFNVMPTGGAMTVVDPMVRMIEAAMMDQSIPMDRLERAIALKKEHDQSEAKKAYNAAFAECQGAIPAIVAKSNNAHTKSVYANLAQIYATAKPIAASFGFSFSATPAPCERDGYIGVNWTNRHSGGHDETGYAEIPMDGQGMKGNANKTPTHAFGSSNSYARRYLFSMVYDIAIVSEDDDGNSGGSRPVAKISEEQFIEIKDKADQLSIDEAVICNAEGIDSLIDLPASRFKAVIGELNTTQKKREAANRGNDVTANMGADNA